MTNEKDNELVMPLRNYGHKVDVVVMPGQHLPTLGERHQSPDLEVDVRAQTLSHWQVSPSPRQAEGQAIPVTTEINLRVKTTLSYELPTPVRNALNRNDFELKNSPRPKDQSSKPERISVKIGF